MPRLEKYIRDGILTDIKAGAFKSEDVVVYYGFDNYERSAEHCLRIIDVIAKEFPGITMNEIEFYEITRAQSNRHAHQTKACVSVPVEDVLRHLDEYLIL